MIEHMSVSKAFSGVMKMLRKILSFPQRVKCLFADTISIKMSPERISLAADLPTKVSHGSRSQGLSAASKASLTQVVSSSESSQSFGQRSWRFNRADRASQKVAKTTSRVPGDLRLAHIARICVLGAKTQIWEYCSAGNSFETGLKGHCPQP